MATVGSAIVCDRLRLYGNRSLCDRLRSTIRDRLRSSAIIWKQVSLRSSAIYDPRSSAIRDRLRSFAIIWKPAFSGIVTVNSANIGSIHLVCLDLPSFIENSPFRPISFPQILPHFTFIFLSLKFPVICFHFLCPFPFTHIYF